MQRSNSDVRWRKRERLLRGTQDMMVQTNGKTTNGHDRTTGSSSSTNGKEPKDDDNDVAWALEMGSVSLIVGAVAISTISSPVVFQSLAGLTAVGVLVDVKARAGLAAGATAAPCAFAAVWVATRTDASLKLFLSSATAAATGLGRAAFDDDMGAVVGVAFAVMTQPWRGLLAVASQLVASRLASSITAHAGRRTGEALCVSTVLGAFTDAIFILQEPPAAVVWFGLAAVAGVIAVPKQRFLFFLGATLGCGFLGWLGCRLFFSVDPIHWIAVDLLAGHSRRHRIVAAWFVGLTVGLPLIARARPFVNRVAARKLFHFLAVLLFTPVAFLDPLLLQVAYGIAIGLLVWLETARHLDGSFVRRHLTAFYAPFLDDDEKSGVALAHIYLLLGCAAPHWLASLIDGRFPLHLVGIVVLGLGDAMAAVVGKASGRFHWPQSKRTYEGSIAFFLAILLPWLLLLQGSTSVGDFLRVLLLPAVLLTVFEATTSQNDNLMLPLFAFALFTTSSLGHLAPPVLLSE